MTGTEPNSGARVYDVSEILEKFGKYQKIQYFYTCLPALLITMININYVFVAANVDYRCRIPECEPSTAPLQRPEWWPSNVGLDNCTKPVLVRSNLEEGSCSTFLNATELCTDWIYESKSTIVGELDLACQTLKVDLVGVVHNVGMLFSMLISGWMADRFGRKPTLIVCSLGGTIGHLKTFATSYYSYISVEFFEAAISGGCYAAAMVIMIEIGGRKKRVLSGVLFAYAVYIGEIVFACLAMLAPHWKVLVRIICTPPIIFITYIVLLKESPRWQILNGKVAEAKDTLRLAAKMNNIKINQQDLDAMDELKLRSKFNISMHERKEGLRKILGSWEIVKRVLVVSVGRFTSSFVYYGLIINFVQFSPNKHFNFLLLTLMSLPGELLALYLMNKIGRKIPLVVGYFLTAVFCFAAAGVPASSTWLVLSCALIAKMMIAMCFTGTITYAMEVFPTSARGSLLGICAFASRNGAMLAPLTPELKQFHANLPVICFGISALCASLLIIVPPETKNLPIMDTIDQVEKSIKKPKNPNGFDNKAYASEESTYI